MRYNGKVIEVSRFLLPSSFTSQQFLSIFTFQLMVIYLTATHLGFFPEIVSLPEVVPFVIYAFALPASFITTIITTFVLIPDGAFLLHLHVTMVLFVFARVAFLPVGRWGPE